MTTILAAITVAASKTGTPAYQSHFAAKELFRQLEHLSEGMANDVTHIQVAGAEVLRQVPLRQPHQRFAHAQACALLQGRPQREPRLGKDHDGGTVLEPA